MEEAVLVATEFLGSLDNLPNEVRYLLSEMGHLDTSFGDVEASIAKHSNRLFRAGYVGTDAHAKTEALPALSEAEEMAAIAKIETEWDTLLRITVQKQLLSRQLERLILKHLRRLEDDLGRLNAMDHPSQPTALVPPVPRPRPQRHILTCHTNALDSMTANHYGMPVVQRLPQLRLLAQTLEDLKQAVDPIVAPPITQITHKRRKPARQMSAATSREGTPSAQPSPALSQGHYASQDDTDNTLYCFCQQPSYGEMIGCDNDDCHLKWFHIPCVGISGDLPDHWFCSECVAKGFSVTNIKKKGLKRR